MQRDPLAELDLAADPTQDLPSSAADVQVDRSVQADDSALVIDVSLWKIRIHIQLRVRGRNSWAAPLCAVVLLTAAGVAFLAPRVMLSPDAAPSDKLVVAATAGVIVVVGGIVLIRWFRRKS